MNVLPAAFIVLLQAAPAPSPAAPPAAPVRAVLADVAWIAGHWVDDSGGNLSEEVWVAPSGDSMIGMWRYVASGKLRISEALSILQDGTGLAFRLRHFDPRMVAREEKDDPLVLRLISRGDREAVFEGPGKPTGTVRLTYRQPAPDSLRVTLDKEGSSQAFEFRRRRP